MCGGSPLVNLDHTQLSKGGMSGQSGGSAESSSSSSSKATFQCPDCGKPYTRKDTLQRHKKFYCPNAKGIDPLEKEKRMKNQADVDPDEEPLAITYKDGWKEMTNIFSSIPSAYAKFRLCENPKDPQAIPGFWPALFDYRGKACLESVTQSICTSDAYKSLAAILTDAHIYHNVASINFKKRAFLETESGDVRELSDYRVPRSHCTVNKGSRVRIDQPRFKVVEGKHDVTISFHERYMELLPASLAQGLTDDVETPEELMETDGQGDGYVEGYHLEELFGEGEGEDANLEEFSQEFDSQMSMEEVSESPVKKKMKLSKPPQPTSSQSSTVTTTPAKKRRCPLCEVYIGGDQRNIDQHITKSCPNNPDIDPLEAARRKKKAEKRAQKVSVTSDDKEEVKEEDKTEPEVQGEPGPFGGGDCGCRGIEHQAGCLKSSPVYACAFGHQRQPRNNPLPQLAPDPDHLPPKKLRPIIPVIQALNQKLSNRQNRWIAGVGPPRLNANIHNTLWPRVVSKQQLPSMFSESEFSDLFFFDRQQMYQFRNAYVYPMLADRAAQAQGARGARSSFPHTLTPDSLACLFMAKVRLNLPDRVVAAQLGVEHRVAQKWLRALRDYYFTHDPFIQRNIDLGNPANLQAILQQGIDATSRDQRTTALYGHLLRPNTQLLVAVMDSRAIGIQQSSDAYLQKRTISTKINDNSVQKMTIGDSSGIPLISFPLMCSISPAGTDESNCEHLITIHENQGVVGGLKAFLESPLTQGVTLILLLDQGFRKFGFDHANRRSFTDYLDNLEIQSNQAFR